MAKVRKYTTVGSTVAGVIVLIIILFIVRWLLLRSKGKDCRGRPRVAVATKPDDVDNVSPSIASWSWGNKYNEIGVKKNSPAERNNINWLKPWENEAAQEIQEPAENYVDRTTRSPTASLTKHITSTVTTTAVAEKTKSHLETFPNRKLTPKKNVAKKRKSVCSIRRSSTKDISVERKLQLLRDNTTPASTYVNNKMRQSLWKARAKIRRTQSVVRGESLSKSMVNESTVSEIGRRRNRHKNISRKRSSRGRAILVQKKTWPQGTNIQKSLKRKQLTSTRKPLQKRAFHPKNGKN